MDVDEVAHAGSVVFCRAPRGDFDLAPGTMHVEENEEIDRTVTTILVIVTFEPAGRGRNRLTRLADELHRAFIEAHHRPLGIGRRGIEVEHVLHAGDVFAVELRNTPHVLAPGFEAIFGQTPPNRLMRQALVFGELDHRTCQQIERPAGAALWRTGASRRYQQSLFLTREFALGPGTRLLAQRPLQIAFHEAPLGSVHGRAAHADAPGDLLVAGPGVGGQQDLRSLELAGRMLATAEQRPEFSALDLAEVDPIAYVHGVPPCSRHAPTTESDGRRESFGKNLHAQAGAVSGLYPPLYAAPPQTPSRDRHAGIFSRQPALGSPDAADAGTHRPHQTAAKNPSQHRGPR